MKNIKTFNKVIVIYRPTLCCLEKLYIFKKIKYLLQLQTTISNKKKHI